MITKPEDIVKMSVGLLQVSSQAAGMANSHRERRQSGVDMDTERRDGIAYEYLCHLEEAKKWMEEVNDDKRERDPNPNMLETASNCCTRIRKQPLTSPQIGILTHTLALKKLTL